LHWLYFVNQLFAFVLRYKINGCVILLTKVGRQGVAIGNFIKCGEGAALTHNKAMPHNCIYVAIATSLQAIAALPYPLLDHVTLPIRTKKEAMGFIILWPWNLTKKFV